MSLDFVINITRQALLHVLIISAPVLISSLIIGLIISIFQATTSIQEQTMTFVPKLIGIFLAIIFFIGFMIQDIMTFTINLFNMFPNLVK